MPLKDDWAPGDLGVAGAMNAAASKINEHDELVTHGRLGETALSATFVAGAAAAGTNKRTVFRDAMEFDEDFPFDAIFDGADGAIVWKQMLVSGGYGGEVGEGGDISYFKAVGGTINHTGDGNIDAFWVSMQHRGPREAGLFIGDVTSRKGGNVYGGHTRVVVDPDDGFGAPLYQASWSHEIFVGAERGAGQVAYGELIDIQGEFSASAAIQIGAQAFTGDKSTAAKSPVVFGINFDTTVASPHATAIMLGGSWGSGINMNANSIVQAGSITGTGSSPNRDVRLVDNLVIDNARHIKFRDASATARKVLGVTSSDNFRFIAAGASKQWEFYDSTEATQVARITGSGRGDFSVAGVTTKYTSGATQPAYLTNGQVEVWHDTGSSTDYLVVNVNGVSKKVALT
jgi:hypothetical protein